MDKNCRKTSPKPFNCDVRKWTFSKSWEFFRIFWKVFWESFWRIFLEEFLGRVVFGGTFLGEIFWEVSLSCGQRGRYVKCPLEEDWG